MNDDLRFPAASRLRCSPQFTWAWQHGRRHHTAHFIVIVCANDASRPRLGLTVSRKVGKAVYRNRLKRWLREYFRTHLGPLGRCLDYSIVAKRSAGSLTHTGLIAELNTLFTRLETDRHV